VSSRKVRGLRHEKTSPLRVGELRGNISSAGAAHGGPRSWRDPALQSGIRRQLRSLATVRRWIAPRRSGVRVPLAPSPGFRGLYPGFGRSASTHQLGSGHEGPVGPLARRILFAPLVLIAVAIVLYGGLRILRPDLYPGQSLPSGTVHDLNRALLHLDLGC